MRTTKTRALVLFEVALIIALVLAPFLSAPRRVLAQESLGGYEVAVQRNVMVEMRDGVHLATDIYRPARNGQPVEGRFATVVTRTVYNKACCPPVDITPDYFVTRGYVFIAQDVRGRYRSEGHWRPFRDDGSDGVDLLKWIGEQPWSNGKVGTTGVSYGGGTQHAVALANAPNLAAMVPVDAMSNAGRYGIRHNGAFELRWLNWAFTLGAATERAPGAQGRDIAVAHAASDPAGIDALGDLGGHVRDYVTKLPLRPGITPLRFARDYETWLIEAMGHGANDSFWTDMGLGVVEHIREYKDVPAYHVTGTYDSWAASVANLNFVELTRSKKSLQRLIIGPWTHSQQTRSFAGLAEFGPSAAIDLNALKLRWFDRWLKDVDNGVDREPPVRIFVMGGGDGHKTPEGRLFVGGVWRDEYEWPVARAVSTTYYLHADKTLSTEAPGVSSPTRYRFDPRHAVPTIGGNISSQGTLMSNGAQDQKCRSDYWLCEDERPLSVRPDVLVFQTPPLGRDVEVTGRIVVKLWASSDGPDTDFTAKLVDVYPRNRDFPDGVDLNIGDSIVRARYRESLTKPKALEPGKPYEFTIELYPTSLVFQHGHRIRLDVSSSNFPRFDVNPNTGEELNNNRSVRVAVNSIYHDPRHPSRIVLPIVPAGSVPLVARSVVPANEDSDSIELPLGTVKPAIRKLRLRQDVERILSPNDTVKRNAPVFPE